MEYDPSIHHHITRSPAATTVGVAMDFDYHDGGPFNILGLDDRDTYDQPETVATTTPESRIYEASSTPSDIPMQGSPHHAVLMPALFSHTPSFTNADDDYAQYSDEEYSIISPSNHRRPYATEEDMETTPPDDVSASSLAMNDSIDLHPLQWAVASSVSPTPFRTFTSNPLYNSCSQTPADAHTTFTNGYFPGFDENFSGERSNLQLGQYSMAHEQESLAYKELYPLWLRGYTLQRVSQHYHPNIHHYYLRTAPGVANMVAPQNAFPIWVREYLLPVSQQSTSGWVGDCLDAIPPFSF